MRDSLSDDLIDRYLAHQLPPEEAERVRAYLARTPGGHGFLQGIRAAVRGDDLAARPSAVASRDALMKKIEAGVPPSHTLDVLSSRVPARRSPWISRGVWSVVGAGVLTALVMMVGRSSPPAPGADAPQTTLIRTYRTERAQRATIDLPDGTRAMLAPETHLQYRIGSNGQRVVALEGQAYFDVTHDPQHPFAVRTGTVITRVLGTAFDVRRYRGDAAAQVTVVTGKVAVTSETVRSGTPLILAPGMTGRVTDTSATASTVADPVAAVGWIDGHLSFTNTPVPTVLDAIGRWYGYEFRLADSTLAARHVTIGLDVANPRDGLNILKRVLGVTMTMQGNVVTLQPRAHAIRNDPRSAAPVRGPLRDTSHSSEVGK